MGLNRDLGNIPEIVKIYGSNVGINTSSDNGYKLEIGGTLKASGAITGNSFVKIGGTSSQLLTADGSVLTAGTGISISGGTISSTVTGGVTSFNTRTGAITLSSTDVTTALGYTPYNSTNPNGYISSYTETDPTVPSHVKSITTTEKSNWNTAFGWGNHASAGYVSSARTITINGTSYDLSANRSWTVTAVETDTLATVTGRGATTTTNITASSIIATASSQANAILGAISSSWGGTSYPTLYGSNADRWIMHINPHISYTQSGVNGFTGSMTGSTIRMASDTAASYYWDIGVGTSGVGVDKFSIGRNATSFLSINNSGGTTINGNLTISALSSNDGMIENNTGGYFHLGGWGVGRTASTAILVNTAYRADYADSAGGVSWGNVSSRPSSIFYYQGFQLDANSMDTNASGFTYAVNAPYVGPVMKIGDGGYCLQLNANYGGGGGALAYRTRNGDAGSFNSWFRVYSDAYRPYADSAGSAGSAGSATWSTNAKLVDCLSDRSDSAFYQVAWVAPNQGTNPGTGNASTYAFSCSGVTIQSSSGTLRANQLKSYNNLYLDNDHGNTVVGVYSPYRFQGVFAMGDSYKLPANGTSCGNHYGISWSHPLAGGEAAHLTDHGMLVQVAGQTRVAISTDIWCIASITAYSDARVKDNIKVIDNPLERIKKVRGVTYTRTDLEDTSRKFAGVIAQEMREALPEVVTEDSNGQLSVAYGNSIGLLIECVKEQQTQIEELKNLVNQLMQK